MAKTYEQIRSVGTFIKNTTTAKSVTNQIVGENIEDIADKMMSLDNGLKGYFTTIDSLLLAFPNPQIGWTAWVGAAYPGTVYDVVSGAWHDTSVIPSTVSVDLSEYIKESEILDKITFSPNTLCITSNNSFSLAKWGDGANKKNIVIEFPVGTTDESGIHYNLDCNIWGFTGMARLRDDHLCFNVDLLCYGGGGYRGVYNMSINKKTGNDNLISNIRLMYNAVGNPCLIFSAEGLNTANIIVSNIIVTHPIIVNKDMFELSIDSKNDEEISSYTLIEYFYLRKLGNFTGKKIAIYGDSITAGYNNGIYETWYETLLKNKTNADILKFGYSSACIARKNGWNNYLSADDRLSNLVSYSPDYIFILGGINDYQLDVNIGTIGDDDLSTMCGALAYILNYIMSHLPNARIICCTPTPYFFQPNYMPSVQSGRMPNNTGNNLRKYVDSIIKTCNEYSVAVVDSNQMVGWLDTNEKNGSFYYTTDGLHLSPYGYDRLTSLQCSIINYL